MADAIGEPHFRCDSCTMQLHEQALPHEPWFQPEMFLLGVLLVVLWRWLGKPADVSSGLTEGKTLHAPKPPSQKPAQPPPRPAPLPKR